MNYFFFKIYFIFYIFYFWLCEGFHQLRWAGATPHRGAQASHRRGPSRCGAQAPDAVSAVVAHGPSRSTACGIFPDRGTKPCALHWQPDSQPLRHQESPHELLLIRTSGASLVAQWLRISLPMQGTRVRALVQEDPTCRGATKPMSHNYWACALELECHNYWSLHT